MEQNLVQPIDPGAGSSTQSLIRNYVGNQMAYYPTHSYTKDVAGTPYKGYSQYDTYLSSGSNQQYVRASNQTNWDRFGNALVDFPFKVATKVLQTGASIGGGVYELGKKLAPGVSGDIIKGLSDNPVLNGIRDFESYLGDEILPVYGDRHYNESNAVGKLGNFSWWAKDFADGAAFAASAYITSLGSAALVGKMGSISKGLMEANLTPGSIKSLANFAGKSLLKSKEFTGLGSKHLLTGLVNTSFEAGAEAYDSAQQITQYYDALIKQAEDFQDFDKVKKLKNEQKANSDAARDSTFMYNAMLLGVTNTLGEAKWFLGNDAAIYNNLRKQILSDTISQSEKAAMEKILAGIGKPKIGKALWNGIKNEAFIEENFQSAIQNRFFDKYTQSDGYKKDSFGDIAFDFASIMHQSLRNAKGFIGNTLSIIPNAVGLDVKGMQTAPHSTEDEASQAMFAAMGLGGGMSAYAEHRGHAEKIAFANAYGERALAYNKNVGLANQHFVENVTQPLNMFEHTTTDAEGNVKTIKRPIDPATGEMSINPEAMQAANKRVSNIMEAHRIAEETILNKDTVGFQRNLKRSIHEWAYDLMSLSKYSLTKEELDTILDSMPAFQDEVMDDLGGKDILLEHKKELRESALAIQKLYNDQVKIKDIIPEKTKAEIELLSEDEREKYLASRDAANLEASINNDFIRTQFYVSTGKKALLEADEDLTQYSNHTEVDKTVLESMSPEQGGRYLDLVDFNSHEEDLTKGDKSVTKKIIRDQLGRQIQRKQDFEKAKKDIAKLNEDIKNETDETVRTKLLEEVSKITKKVFSQQYFLDEANRLEGFTATADIVDYGSETSFIPHYNISDSKLRKVGAPRHYKTGHTPAIAAKNEGRSIAEQVYERLLSSIDAKLDNTDLSLDELEAVSKEISDIVDKFGKVSIGSQALLQVIEKLQTRYIPYTEEIEGQLLTLEDVIRVYSDELSSQLQMAEAMFNSGEEEVEYFRSQMEELLQQLDDDIAANIADGAITQDLYDQIINKITQKLQLDSSNPIGSMTDIFYTLFEKVVNTEEDPSVFENFYDAINEVIAEWKTHLEDIQTNFTYLANKTLSKDQILEDINNNKEYQKNPNEFNLNDVFDTLFSDKDQGTLKKFQFFIDYIYSKNIDMSDKDAVYKAVNLAELHTLFAGKDIDVFTDINLVENTIMFLRQAKDAYESREDVNNPFKEKMLEKINNLLNAYEIIHYKTTGNLAKLDAKNQLYLDFKVEGIFKVLGLDETGQFDKQNKLIQLLNTILEGSGFNAFSELDYQKGENSFSNLMGLLALAKTKATKEQLVELESFVKDFEKAILDKFLNEHSLHPAVVSGIKKHGFDGLLENFKGLISTVLGNPTKEFIQPFYELPGSALFQILEHGNYLDAFLKIKNDVDSKVLTPEQGKAFEEYIEKVIQPLVGLNDFKKFLKSEHSYIKLKTEIEKVSSELGFNLSQQQFASAMDMLLFLNTENGIEENMGYAATFTGVLGSGKSTLLGIVLKIHNKLNSESKLERVKGIGHVRNSSKNINKHIDSSRVEDTIIKEVTADYLKNVDILIIDEAFALSNNQIGDLHNLITKENNTRNSGNKIKVLFAGDMSQNKVEDDHVLLTYSGLFGITGGLKSSNAITRISPLATIYRSNIQSITDALLKFKDMREEVPAIDTLSNISNLQEYHSYALGVVQINGQQLPQFLATRDTSKEAIIIVNNDKEVVQFLAELAKFTSKNVSDLNIQVLSYYDVQSITTDEVYILLNKNVKNHAGKEFTTKAFNTAMYTSIGRAKNFVGISSNSVVVHSTKQSVDNSIDMGDAIKDQLKASRELIEAGFTDGAERYFNVKREKKEEEGTKEEGTKEKKPEIISPEVSMDTVDDTTGEEEDEYSDEDGVQVEPVEDIEDIIPDVINIPPVLTRDPKAFEGHFVLTEHTNQNIKKVLEHLPDGKLTAKIIAVKDNDTNDPQREIRYLVVTEDKDGAYFTVAQLTEDDLNSTFAHLPSVLKGKKIMTFNDGMKAVPADNVLEELEIIDLQKASYAYKTKEEEANPASFENIIMQWVLDFYGLDTQSASQALFGGKTVSPANIDWSKFSIEVVTYNLFNKYKLGRRGFDPKNILGSVLLTIKGYNLKAPNALPQVVILSQAHANIGVNSSGENEWHNRTIKPIQKFTEAVLKLEAIFNEDNFIKANIRAKKLFLGDGHKTLNTDIIDEFAKLGYEYFIPGLPLRSDVNEIIKKILSSKDVEFDTSKLADEDINKFVRLLDDVVRMLYSPKIKRLVIENTDAAKEDAKRIFGNNYTLDFEQVVGKEKAFVQVRILDASGNLEKAEVEIHGLGGTEVTQAWNRLASGIGHSTYKGVQYNVLSKADENDSVKKRYLSPKSLLSLRHGAKTRADGSTKLGWTAQIKSRFRWVVLEDERGDAHAQNVDPQVLKTLRDSVQELRDTEFGGRNFQGKTDNLINYLKERHPEESKALTEAVYASEGVPITSSVLQELSNIQPGEPIQLDNGKFIRLHTDTSVASVSLTNQNSRENIQKKLTSKFIGYNPPSLILKNKENFDVEKEAAILEQHINKFIGNEDDPNSGYTKATKEHLEGMQNKFKNSNLDWLSNLIFSNLGTAHIYIAKADLLKGFALTYEILSSGKIVVLVSEDVSIELLGHELLHAVTIAPFNKPESARTDKEKKFVKRIQAIQQIFDVQAAAKTKKPIEKIYQDTVSKLTEKEFLANLSNSEFVELLKQIKYKSKKSLLKMFVEAVAELFGLNAKDNPTLFDLTVQSLEEFLANNTEEPVVVPVTKPVGDTVTEKLENKLVELEQRYANDLNSLDYKTKVDTINSVLDKLRNNEDVPNRIVKAILSFAREKQKVDAKDATESGFQRVGLHNISELKKAFNISPEVASVDVFNKGIFELKKEFYLALEKNSLLSGNIPMSYLEAKKEAFRKIQANYKAIENQFKIEALQKLSPYSEYVINGPIESLDNLSVTDLNIIYNDLVDLYNLLKTDDTFYEVEQGVVENALTEVKNLINKYQKQVIALKVLSENKGSIFNKSVRYIFNNWGIVEKEVDDANLTNEIQSNDERNLVSSFTEPLKNYLSLIPIKDEHGEIVNFVLPKTAIKFLFQLFEGDIDLSDLNQISRLKSRLEQIRATGLNTKEDKAILDKLLQSLNQFYSEDSNTPKNVSIFLDVFNKSSDIFTNVIYFVETVDPNSNIDLEGLTHKEAEYLHKGKVKVTKYESLEKLIAEKEGRIPRESLISMFLKVRAFNDLSNIKSYLGSATNVTYVEVEEKAKFNSGTEPGDFALSRYTAAVKKATATTRTKTKEHLLTNIIDLFSGQEVRIDKDVLSINAENFEKTFGPIARGITSAGSNRAKVQGLTKFLSLFNLEYILKFESEVLNSEETTNLVNDISTAFLAFYNELKDEKSEIHNVFKLSDPKVREDSQIDYNDLVDNIRIAFTSSGAVDIFVNRLSTLAAKHNQVQSLNAIKTSDGKMLIEYIPTNAYRQVLKDLKKPVTQRKYVNSAFFQHNIFVNGINTVVDPTTRFLLRKSGNYLTLANKFSPGKRLELFVDNLFFSQIGKSNEYYQTLYQQGEATKSELPKIKFLDLNKILSALDTMLLQLDNLDENVTNKKDYNTKQRIGFSVYDKAKAIVGEGDLQDTNYRDSLKKEILKLFLEEAKSLHEDFTKKQLKISDGVKTAFSKIKNTYASSNLDANFSDFFKKLTSEDELSENLNNFAVHTTTFKETNYPSEVDFTFMLFAYVANNYVNSFGLSQLAYGDLNQWKSLENLNKRAQLSASPGYYGTIHEKYGLPKKAHILMANDVLTSGSEYNKLLGNLGLGEDKLNNILHQISTLVNKERKFDTIERTDGTLFVTPRFYYKLQKGFGSGLDLQNVMKDQAFGWTEQVLADTTKQFSSLDELRKYLNKERLVENVHYIKEEVLGDTYEEEQVVIPKPILNRVEKLFSDARFSKELTDLINKSVEETKDFYGKYLKHVHKNNDKTSTAGFKSFVENYVPALKQSSTVTYYPTKIQTSTVGLKNALIVLDDNFINSNAKDSESREQLKKLREFIDTAEFNGEPISMLSFMSANKAPFDNAMDVFDEKGNFVDNSSMDTNKAVVTMGMDLFKIQYNPHSSDQTTAAPRQILHFLSTVGNSKNAINTYTALAQLQNILFHDMFNSGKLGSTKLNKKQLEKMLRESIKEGQDNFTVVNGLDSKLSLDHPTLVQKVITIVGSMLNKSASRIRLPGGKLILRSDIGYTTSRANQGKKKLQHRITKDGTIYAEAVIPKHFLTESQIKAIESGQKLFLTPDMFGFRIPSGDLNAGILIEVVDYYEADGNSNIAILPDLEIFKQGWDFDVDALFLLKFDELSRDYVSEKLTLKKGQLAGFEMLNQQTAKSVYDLEDDDQFIRYEKLIINDIVQLDKNLAANRDQLLPFKKLDKQKLQNNPEYEKLIAIRRELKNDLRTLKQARVSLLKNQVIKGIMSAYLDPLNNDRVMDVTTTKIVDDAVEVLKASRSTLNADGIYVPDNAVDPSFVRDNIKVYSNVNEAANAIGIYAKGSSVSAYVSNAGKVGTHRRSGISTHLQFVINDFLVDRLDPKINVFGDNTISYKVSNKLLNAFLDALKVPKIFTIGFNGANASMIDSALSLGGMKFVDILLLFNHPLVREGFKNRSIRALLKSVEESIVNEDGSLKPIYTDLSLTTRDLRDAYDADYSNIEDLVAKQGNNLEELNSEIESEDSVGVAADESTASNTETTEEITTKDLKNLDQSVFKMLMLLHKISKISESKYKLISLVNLAQDKPTTIAQIFNWEENIRKVFKQEFLDDILFKHANWNSYGFTTKELQDSLVKSVESIRSNYEDETILAKGMDIDAEFILEKNPHLAVALIQTLLHVKNLKENFAIFSPEAISVMNSFVPIVNNTLGTTGQAKQNGLFALSDLLVSSYASNVINTLATNIKRFTKTNKRFQDVIGINAFSNNLVLMLQAVEKYENKQILTDPYYSRNVFLENISFKSGVPATIKTIEPFTEYSFQNTDYHKAFNDLAKFDFVEKYNDNDEFIGYEALFNPTKNSSMLQHDLVTYAAYKYGLRGSSNNFINAIDPTFMAENIQDINSVYNVWIKDNQDVRSLRNLYKMYTVMQYPSSVPLLNHYERDDKYNTSSRKKSDEAIELEASMKLEAPDMFYDLLISTDYVKKRNLPFLIRENESKNVMQQNFLVLANTVQVGDKIIGIYHKLKYGEIILTDKPYILEDHFRTDLPTMKFKGSNEYDIHAKTVVDEQGVEHPNIFSIRYEEKFHTERFLKEFIYGTYASDTVRHTISKLQIMNLLTYKEDKVLEFRVVEDDIGYKKFEEGEWTEIPTQDVINKHGFNKKKGIYQFKTRGSNDIPTKFAKDEVYVYISNDENLPIKGQVKTAFGKVTDVEKKRKNSKTIKAGDYGIVGRANTIVDGRKGKGFGLAFNKIINNKEVIGTASDVKKSFKSLLQEAKNNPEFKFVVTLNNTTDLNKFGIRELVQLLLSLNMSIPSNIEFNSNFANELNAQIKNKKAGDIVQLQDFLDPNFLQLHDPIKIYKSIKSTYRGIKNWKEEFVMDLVGENPTPIQTASILLKLESIIDAATKKAISETDEADINFAYQKPNTVSDNFIDLILSDLIEDRAEEIKKNCKGSGGLTAESGLTIGFTPGSKWSLVKDLKGPSHAQGGIDLSIDNGKVMYSDGNTKFHAADGLVLPSKSTNPTANRFPIVDQIKQEGMMGPETVITAPKPLTFNAINEKSGTNEVKQLQMHLNKTNAANLKVDGVYGPMTKKAHDEGFLVGANVTTPAFKPSTLQDENRNVRLERSEQTVEKITKQNAGITNYPAIPEIKNPKGTLNFQNYGKSFDCAEKQCGEFVQNEIYRAGNFSKTRKETMSQLGLDAKNAWEFSDALVNKGGKSIYDSKQSSDYIETPKPGDIASIYTGGRSPYQKAANKYETSTGRGSIGDTHVGIITKVYPDGSYDVSHNVHKKDGKDDKGNIIYKGNASTDRIVNHQGKDLLKSWMKVTKITRPNYESLENKGLSIDPNVTLQTTAKDKHITETVSQFNKNKSSIGNYLKVSDKDLMPIAKAALGILEQESNYGKAFEKSGVDLRTPYEEVVKVAKGAKNLYKLTKGENPNEVASEGSARIKYSQHFTNDELGRMQGLTNVSNPQDNYGSLVATMSILTKNYKEFIKKGYNEEDALYRAITNHNSPSKAKSKGRYADPENDVVSQYNAGYTNKVLFYANKFNVGTKKQRYSSHLERLATKKEVIENTKNLTLNNEN